MAKWKYSKATGLTLEIAYKYGHVALELRKECSHSEWLKQFTPDNFGGYSYRRVMDFIQIAENWDLVELYADELPDGSKDISINGALKLIRQLKKSRKRKTKEEAIEAGRQLLEGEGDHLKGIYTPQTIARYKRLYRNRVEAQNRRKPRFKEDGLEETASIFASFS